MSRYLLIAYQTAENPALMSKLKSLRAAEQGAQFVLLVPETAAQHLRLSSVEASLALALEAANRAQVRYRAEGIELDDVHVRDPNPVVAVQEELMADPDFDGIVISTFAPGASRWLKMDVVSRVQRMTQLPVVHVVAPEPATET